MPRVLIPSDNADFVHYLAQAYRRVGWEATVGKGNFELGTADFDLVHFQWPEELCGWNVPSDATLEKVFARLEMWRTRARLAMTLHNLQPHRDGAAPNYRRLYEGFFDRVPVVAHFTETSRELVLKEYPDAALSKHIVTGYFNHLHLVKAERGEGHARMGDGFVVLVFGALREWDEVMLVREAYDQSRVSGKRLIFAASYDEPATPWKQRWRRWELARWLRSRRALVRQGFIPDDKLHKVLEAADAIVIPRFRAINSGQPGLAASFGRIVIAPRCGSYPELLGDTPNPLYQPGNAQDLAKAIEEAAALDRMKMAGTNRHLAESWNWDRIVASVINTVAAARP